MCWCLHLRQRTGPELDPKILYLESADCMVQYTLRTDLIPGAGPSSDQLYPYEVRPSHRSTEADCHGVWREEKGGRNQIWDSCRILPGPSTPGTKFRGLASIWGGSGVPGVPGRRDVSGTGYHSIRVEGMLCARGVGVGIRPLWDTRYRYSKVQVGWSLYCVWSLVWSRETCVSPSNGVFAVISPRG